MNDQQSTPWMNNATFSQFQVSRSIINGNYSQCNCINRDEWNRHLSWCTNDSCLIESGCSRINGQNRSSRGEFLDAGWIISLGKGYDTGKRQLVLSESYK